MPNTPATLLIIDDEAALMKALCDTLQSEGYKTVGFTSAREALSALREQSFDVVLTDLMMPEMDGISVLDAAFAIDPNLVGIVMTGHGSVNTAVNALKTGALDYILKPFKLNAILPVLTRALTVRRLRIENIQLREAVGLYELSMAIAFASNSDAVLQKVADAAFEQSKARGMSILLTAETGAGTPGHRTDEELYVAAVRGAGMERLAGTLVPLSADLQRWAVGFTESLTSSEMLSQSELIPGIPPGLAVPMHNGGKLIGILHFQPANPTCSFTPGQRKALSILASTAASALTAAFGLERLRGAEKRYRRLAEDAPDVVSRYELYPKAGYSYVNPAVMTATGYSPEEYYSDPDLAIKITHSEDRGLAQKALAGELASGSAITLRWVNKSGAVVWIEQRIALVHNRRGQLVAIETVSRDITQRRILEERLRQSQKLEAIGKLTAGVAHDFNNLLTIINGYCALALREVGPTTPTWRKLDEVKKAGDQAAEMTNQLLAFSRKQVLQPRTINLAHLLDDMNQMIHRLVGDSVQVSTRTAPGLGDVMIDPTQMKQVILNLAVNARDAMTEEGTLDFELSNVEWEQAQRIVSDIAQGSYVMLTVADSGCGMTPEVKQKVFEPFFTTKEAGHGTGLGLATVYGIVEQSGGHIQIDSEPGLGTKFTILLPRSGDRAEAVRRDSPAMLRGHETILVAEDDAGVLTLTSEILTGAGYVVLAAEDGAAALRLAHGNHGRIDLLVTDMSLPGMRGTTLAQRIRAIQPQVRILFISGYTGSTPPRLDDTSDEPAEFLAKPFTPEDLSAKVRKVLNAGQPLKRVLVVDDDRAIRCLLKEILEGAGFEVLTAANGREAKSQVADSCVDLVITDLLMPEMDGIELIAAVRKERHHVKLIATTGGSSLDLLRAARHLGAHATLPKPLTPDSVLTCIRELTAV